DLAFTERLLEEAGISFFFSDAGGKGSELVLTDAPEAAAPREGGAVQALRKLTGGAHRTGTTLIFINTLRQKIGVTFGNPETTTGGNALKFYASVRIDVRRIGPIKVSEESVGSRTRAKIVKNKMAVPFREAEFDIRWGTGIDTATDLLDYGVQ